MNLAPSAQHVGGLCVSDNLMRVTTNLESIRTLIVQARALISAAVRLGPESGVDEALARIDAILSELLQKIAYSATTPDNDPADSSGDVCIHRHVSTYTKRPTGDSSASLNECEPLESLAVIAQDLSVLLATFARVTAALSRERLQRPSSPHDGNDTLAGPDEQALEATEDNPAANELEQLFVATIQRYKEGHWRSAAEAARHITPEIVDLAATLSSKRAGKPLLRKGTVKPLEWIRLHRRSKQ